MNLVLLRRFEAVCRLRSFSRAADEFGISHAAMTKSIRMLEEDIGAQLLDRTTRAVALTDVGAQLLDRASELITHAADVRSSIARGGRELRVCSGATVLDTFVKDGLLEFRQRHPDVHLDLRLLSVSESADQLSRRQADLLVFNSVTADELADTRWMRKEVIFTEPIVAMFRAGHPILERDFSTETFLGYDWVAVGFTRHLQESLPEPLRGTLKRVRFPKYLVPTQDICLNLVSRSDVITYGPESIMHNLPAGAAIESAPFPFPVRYEYAAYTRADGPPSPLATAFVDAIRSVRRRVLGTTGEQGAAKRRRKVRGR